MELSDIFGECKIKSLLLPQIGHSDEKYDFMTSYGLLNELYNIHRGTSCLILQPQACPRNTTIFDAFPNLDVALR